MNQSTHDNTADLSGNTKLLMSAQAMQTKWLSRCYPWIVIALCSLFLFYKYILQVSPSVMTNELMSAFQVQAAGLGNLAATFFYAYLIAQFFVGPLLDRYSPRYLTAAAIMLCALATLIFAKSNSLWLAEIARALMGVGAAFATVSYMKMSAIWFPPNKVAFVDGLLATAAMIGAVCGQLPLTVLVTNVGWRDSLIYCALAGMVVALLFWLIARDKKPGISSSIQENQNENTFQWKELVGLLKNKKNWLLTFYSGLAFTPVAVLGGLWGNPFFIEAYQLTRAQAATFTSCIFIGLAVGGPLFGYFADRVGKRINVMMAGSWVALIALSLAIYMNHLPLMVLGTALFLFGLGSGAFMLSYPFGKSINKLGLAATVVALINTGDALFGSITEPLVGKVLDGLWQGQIKEGVHYFTVSDYQIALIVLPIYLAVALVCLWRLKKAS